MACKILELWIQIKQILFQLDIFFPMIRLFIDDLSSNQRRGYLWCLAADFFNLTFSITSTPLPVTRATLNVPQNGLNNSFFVNYYLSIANIDDLNYFET